MGVPDISILPNLAHVLSVSIDDILYGQDGEVHEGKLLYQKIVTLNKKECIDYWKTFMQDHFLLKSILIVGGIGLFGFALILQYIKVYVYFQTSIFYYGSIILGLFLLILGIISHYVLGCLRKTKSYEIKIYSDYLKYNDQNQEITYYYKNIQKVIETQLGYIFKFGQKNLYLFQKGSYRNLQVFDI